LTAAAFAAAALAASAFAVAAFAAAAFAAAALVPRDDETADALFAAVEPVDDAAAAWLVAVDPAAAAVCSEACSAEGVRLQPVSESAPMLMAMAMFFLSKRPLRAKRLPRRRQPQSRWKKNSTKRFWAPVVGAGAA
jgi:hypothetical protein